MRLGSCQYVVMYRQKVMKMDNIIVTPEMVEDLLHRNKVDIEFKKKEIKEFNKRIENLDERIKKLSKDRAGLLKVLEEVKEE